MESAKNLDADIMECGMRTEDIASMTGLSAGTVAKHRTGNRKIGLEAAMIYSKLFNKPLSRYGQNERKPKCDVAPFTAMYNSKCGAENMAGGVQ